MYLDVEGSDFIQENLAVGRGAALKTFTNHKICQYMTTQLRGEP
jgi:hypothetical protein